MDAKADLDRLEAERHAQDQRDVRAVRAGDVEAFGGVVHRHADDLRRLLSRFFRDASDVDDLLQESLVRAFRSLEAYDASRALGPWLRKIAVNLALDEVRRRRRRDEVVDPEDVLTMQSDATHSDDRVQARELGEALREGIDALPPDWAAVLRLRAHEEMSYAEIADALDLPIGTVMSRLARARARLSQSLAARFGAATAEELP